MGSLRLYVRDMGSMRLYFAFQTVLGFPAQRRAWCQAGERGLEREGGGGLGGGERRGFLTAFLLACSPSATRDANLGGI